MKDLGMNLSKELPDVLSETISDCWSKIKKT